MLGPPPDPWTHSSNEATPANAPDTVPAMEVTAEAARRFFVARHLLAPARSLNGGPDAVLEVFRRLGSVQFDPLAVAGRNHDLVLHARVADYNPAWLDELLYERRVVADAYNKGLNLVPTDELPLYRAPSAPATRILADNAEVAEQVLSRIRAEGPLSVVDFERGPKVDSMWGSEWPTNVVRAVLDAYFASGALGIARRDGNRRYYDLAERLFPKKAVEREEPLRAQLRHKQLSRFRAHGLLGVGGAGDMWQGLGPSRPDPERPDFPSRSEIRDELLADGAIVPVKVEGVGKRFVLREEVELLAAPPEPPPSVAFLAPMDPFMWDRNLIPVLFDFDWVWEVFTPEPKRRWGYYVLPVIFRDRLVGRIEPRLDREPGVVHVIGLWGEDGFEPRGADGFVDAMREALRAYFGFARASRLEWAPHLNAEKRLFVTRP
jgi:uncharacterized protein YcaQ